MGDNKINMKFKSNAQRKAVMSKLNGGSLGRSSVKTHNPRYTNKVDSKTIVPHYVPQGSGNNPYGGKRELHYKIKEWGFVFPSKESAEKYAKTHIRLPNGIIVKRDSNKEEIEKLKRLENDVFYAHRDKAKELRLKIEAEQSTHKPKSIK